MKLQFGTRFVAALQAPRTIYSRTLENPKLSGGKTGSLTKTLRVVDSIWANLVGDGLTGSGAITEHAPRVDDVLQLQQACHNKMLRISLFSPPPCQLDSSGHHRCHTTIQPVAELSIIRQHQAIMKPAQQA